MLEYIVPIITAAIFGSATPTTTGLDFNKTDESKIHTALVVDVGSDVRAYKSATPARSGHPASISPVLLEINATGSFPYKGVIFGTSREQFSTSVHNVNLHVKARLKHIGGVPVYVGTAIAPPASSPSAGQSRLEAVAWTFIAIPSDMTLNGPEVGRIFNLYGAAVLDAVCVNKKIDGMMAFSNFDKNIAILGTFAAPLANDNVCSSKFYKGVAKANLDAKVIQTHIGPILSSEGYLNVKGQKGVDIFSIGVAQNLTQRGDIADVTLRPHVHVLDAEASAEFLGFTPNGFAVLNDLKGNLAGLALDDFIISKARPKFPNGFLRKVIDIRNISGKVVLKTEQGYLNDILQDTNIDINRSYNVADVIEGYDWYGLTLDTALLTPPSFASKLRSSPNGFIDINVNKVVFDYDGDHSTKDDQVLVTGNISFTPKIKIKFNCSGAFCSSIYFLASFGADESSSVKLKGTYKKTVHKTFDLPPTLYLPPITAGPLVFVPEFSVQLHVDGSLSVSITYEASQEIGVEAGVEYVDGSFGVFSDLSNSATSNPPVFSGEIGAEAELAVKGSFMLYGLAGVYADLGGYVTFDAGIPRDPTWELRGGFRAGVGVDIDVIIWSEQFGIDLFDQSWQIDHAPNMPPQITIEQPSPRFSGSQYDKIVVLGGEVSIAYAAQDPESSAVLNLDFTSNLDGVMATNKKAQGDNSKFFYTFLTEGIHQVTATSTDAEGLTGTTTIDVEVVDVDFMVHPGVVSANFPSVVYVDESSTLQINIDLNDSVVIDKVEWWMNDVVTTETLPNGMTRAHIDPNPTLLATSYASGDPQTHSIDYTFVNPGFTSPEQNETKNINAHIFFTRAGVPSQVEIHSFPVLIKPRHVISGNITNFTASTRTPKKDTSVTFTPTLAVTDPKCNRLTYISSDISDGVNGYLGQAEGALSYTFTSNGKRTITASINHYECGNDTASVSVDVTRDLGGQKGTSPVELEF